MKVYMVLILAGLIFVGFGLAESALASGDDHDHNSHGSFSPAWLVRPLGICALSLLLTTFLIGLFRRRLGRRFVKLHIVFASLTVVVAAFHGTLVLVLF